MRDALPLNIGKFETSGTKMRDYPGSGFLGLIFAGLIMAFISLLILSSGSSQLPVFKSAPMSDFVGDNRRPSVPRGTSVSEALSASLTR